MTRIDRRAHDRKAEAVSGRRTWQLLGMALLVTAVACWALLRALSQ